MNAEEKLEQRQIARSLNEAAQRRMRLMEIGRGMSREQARGLARAVMSEYVDCQESTVREILAFRTQRLCDLLRETRGWQSQLPPEIMELSVGDLHRMLNDR